MKKKKQEIGLGEFFQNICFVFYFHKKGGFISFMIDSDLKNDPMFNRDINDEQVNTQPPSESNDGVFSNLNPAEIPTETREYKYERSKKEVK